MRKNYTLTLILLLFSIVVVFSQEFERELKEAVKTKPKVEIRLDSRSSFINQTGVSVFGAKLGVQFDDKLSFGLGFNQLNSTITEEVEFNSSIYNSRLVYYNFSPYVEYVFYRDEKWELSIPVQFGFGSSYYLNNQEGPKKLYQQFVISYEPAITFQYRFLKYFGVGMGVGYRLMLKPNTKVEEQFTSPVYLLKTKVYFQDILKDLRGN